MVVPLKASTKASVVLYFEMFRIPNTNANVTNGKFINLKEAVEKHTFVDVCILN